MSFFGKDPLYRTIVRLNSSGSGKIGYEKFITTYDAQVVRYFYKRLEEDETGDDASESIVTYWAKKWVSDQWSGSFWSGFWNNLFGH
ncbi:hypothetical protein AAVH_37748 [Aphelenchoides avenae]|nr:hypothetical protein AAVH_37748 [Aphelenchus avenae]